MHADPQPQRFQLEVQFEPEPIRGRLHGEGDDAPAERAFSGWLGLMSAIEAARWTPLRDEEERR